MPTSQQEQSDETARSKPGQAARLAGIFESADARLLASQSLDDTVRLWSCDSWDPLERLDYQCSMRCDPGLDFHPSAPVLASLGAQDRVVRIWELDVGGLLARPQDPDKASRDLVERHPVSGARPADISASEEKAAPEQLICEDRQMPLGS